MDHAPHRSPPIRHILGCMTGTSLDGLDVALTRITGTGLRMTAELVDRSSVPLPAELREQLLSLARGEAHPPLTYLRAARHLGVVHAQACAELLARHVELVHAGGISFVVAHGQTIWHAPQDALSWQLFDPWPLVRALDLPVCFDLRQTDLIAGGEGAPLTPLADWVLYPARSAMIVNLGGIVNVTRLHRDPSRIEAGDVGPCNLLLDGLAQRLFDVAFDEDGQRAATGRVQPLLIQRLQQEIARGRSRQRSLGREVYSAGWLDGLVAMAQQAGHSPADLLRTAVQTVADAVLESAQQAGAEQMVLAGGGSRNAVLRAALQDSSPPVGVQPLKVVLSDELGIPAEAREAMGFAVLGALSQDGVPISLPQVTGAEAPGVAGIWAYPRRGG